VRQIPLPILREMLYGNPAIVDLVEVFISREAEPDLRFALHDQKVVFRGQTYIAAGGRTPLRTRSSLSDALGDLTIVLPDVNRTLAAIVATADIAGTPVTIRRVLTNRLSAGESQVFYQGTIVAPVSLQGRTMAIRITPIAADNDDLSSIPGRPWSHGCTVRFGGPDCGLNLEDWTYSGAVGDGSTILTIHDEDLDAAAVAALETSTGLDDEGQPVLSAVPSIVKFTSGVNSGQWRPAASVDACRIVLRKPFYSAPEVGDTYELIRQCPKTVDACEGFDNLDRFHGFSNSPKQPRNLMRELLR
jgi:hypothetical protein